MGLKKKYESFEKVGEWDTYVQYFEYDCDQCGWNFEASEYEPEKGCCPHCGHDNGPYWSDDDGDNLKADAAALAVWAFNDLPDFEDL